MEKVNKTMLIGEILRMDEGIADILLSHDLHCAGCPGAQSETLTDAGERHDLDVDALVAELNAYLASK